MITKALLNDVRADIKLALQEIANKHGLEVDPELRITYSDNSFYFKKITFIEGTVEEHDKNEFLSNCRYYGLSENDWNAKFLIRNEVYMIVGLETKRNKYPIRVKNIQTDKEILVTVDGINKFKRILE